uniref:Uncharacterized protein n=1 Tax=Romanomermis culicivorax TaxID=13658 RepID=A0A915LAB8_ROMCU
MATLTLLFLLRLAKNHSFNVSLNSLHR